MQYTSFFLHLSFCKENKIDTWELTMENSTFFVKNSHNTMHNFENLSQFNGKPICGSLHPLYFTLYYVDKQWQSWSEHMILLAGSFSWKQYNPSKHMTSKWRHTDVDVTSSPHIHVSTSFQCYVPPGMGFLRYFFVSQPAVVYKTFQLCHVKLVTCITPMPMPMPSSSQESPNWIYKVLPNSKWTLQIQTSKVLV